MSKRKTNLEPLKSRAPRVPGGRRHPDRKKQANKNAARGRYTGGQE